ncbi:hypothetical protein TNCV_1375621 [Trichonephila clavipes]|nr:hypothetical protein TNCV_1375621 [Trichonephila clavipes]
MTDWRRVIFSESLSADDHRTRVWRRSGTAFIVEQLQQFHKIMLVHIRLSQQCLQGYDVLPWPARCRSFANRACLRRAGKATAAVEIQEN